MRNKLRKLLFLGVIQMVAWTGLQAQLTEEEAIALFPKGFPTEGVTWNGGTSFTSQSFGAFELDADSSVENRVIHSTLGPFVWIYDDATEVATILSEWWGPLETSLMEGNALGFVWPYVKSEYTGNIHLVWDPMGETPTPFVVHRQDEVTGLWVAGEQQSAIGVDLESAENYYFGAETMVQQMQQLVFNMGVMKTELQELPIIVGSTNIEDKSSQIEATFVDVDSLYGRFLWYANRLSNAPYWTEQKGGDETAIGNAQNYVIVFDESLNDVAVSVYNEGLTVKNDAQAVTAVKFQERNAEAVRQAEEAARKKAEEEAKKNNNSGSSGSSGGSSGSSGGSSGGSTGGSSGGIPSGSLHGSCTSPFINDDLQGGTKGQQNGGSFTSEGYKPGSSQDHILYKLSDTVKSGYVEFEAKGMRHSGFDANSDHAFFIQYDARGINEPIDYLSGYKHNFFRWNVHYRQNRKAMKAVIICAKPGESLNSGRAVFHDKHDRDFESEPTGASINWDPNKWYKFKVEWKGGNFKVYIDGLQMWATSGPYEYAPGSHRMRLGSGPGKYGANNKNIVYRNFKAYNCSN